GRLRGREERRAHTVDPEVVDDAQAPGLAPGPEHLLGGLQQRAQLGVAVAGGSHVFAVDPEGDVVEKDAAVDLADVDAALDPGRERAEGAGRVARSGAERAGHGGPSRAR